MKLAVALSILLAAACSAWEVKIFSQNGLSLIRSAGNAYDLVLDSNGTEILRGQLGLALPNATGTATATCDPAQSDICYEWGDYARLYLKSPSGPDNCGRVEWVSGFGRKLEDCFNLVPGVHWYGGGVNKVQTWPIETVQRSEAPFVTGDFLQGVQYGGVLETYWLTSSGVAIHVDEDTPLFTSWNTSRQGQVCFSAQDRHPYTTRSEVRLKYDFCARKAGENMKDVHIRSLKRYYSTPSVLPDLDMLRYPFWSTWAQYKQGVNQSIVLDMARRMIQEGYTINSHIEIDDHWETCYGEAVFNPVKFPDPAGMTRELAELGIRKTTVWIHPFINYDCPSFDAALRNSYFIRDTKSKPTITSWWQGQTSGMIDWSNEDAVNWWRARLQKLQRDYNITSFKFDAGEANWLPASYQTLTGESDLLPNILTTKYVDAVAAFGGMIETRAAHRNQGLSFFVRMMDKDSRWDNVNGLRSLIPTLLVFSVLGYSYTLPDMIGGNQYGDAPSNELYIRWAQANVFMPSWQFSVLPWDVDPTGVRDRAVKAAVDLRVAYADDIVAAAQQTLVDGSPMNRPMWWVDPTDPQTFTIDDQFMLGDNILAAPVVKEGALSRDIYLPKGNWQIDTATGPQNFTGPQWLRDWPAPIDVLPFLRRLS